MGFQINNCSSCGKAKRVHYVTADKESVCEQCFQERFSASVCHVCRTKRRVASIRRNGPVCHLCFYRVTPKISCVQCGRLVPVVVGGLCQRCLYEQPKQQRQRKRSPRRKAGRTQRAIPKTAPLLPEPLLVSAPALPERSPLEIELEAAIEQGLALVGMNLAALSVNFPSGAIKKARQEACDWLVHQTQTMPDPEKQSCALAYIGSIIALRISSWAGKSQRGRAQKEWGERFQETKDQGFEEEDLLSLNRRITASIPAPPQRVPIRA